MAVFELLVLAIILESAFNVFFEWKWIKHLHGYGLKVPFAFGVAFLLCWWHEFDIIARILDPSAQTTVGITVTAAILAGDSKGVMEMIRSLKNARQSVQ